MESRVAAGALGPRLAGRLTAELILRSPQYMNCVKEYELDLRGNKIATIENLGATENQFDSIDLSDNAIVKLEGFPKLPRLKWLLLNNNKISRIARKLEESIPNLEWLMLTSNRLTNLADLDALSTLSKLKHLSLLDNPVTKKTNYRLYVIAKCKKLKDLDFRKVKQQERDQANKLFGEQPAEDQNTFEPDEELAQVELQKQAEIVVEEPQLKKGPTPEQITAIKAAIANAQTLEEVQRLESALKGGHLPSEFNVDGTTAAANGDHPTNMDED